MLRHRAAEGELPLDLMGEWDAGALSELRGQLLVCARPGAGPHSLAAGGGAAAAAGRDDGGVMPTPGAAPKAEEASPGAPAAAASDVDETLPSSKRARGANAPAPTADLGSSLPPQACAVMRKGPAAPHAAALTTLPSPVAQLALSSPPAPLTVWVLRGGDLVATLHDLPRCLAQVQPGDTVHARGVHRGAGLELRTPRVTLRGWPVGAPPPPPDAPHKGLTVERRVGSTALAFAADDCAVEGVCLAAADALVVVDEVANARMRGCELRGPGPGNKRSGVGAELRRGCSAAISDTVVHGFSIAGVAARLDAQLKGRRISVHSTAGACFRLDGARSSELLECEARGAPGWATKMAFFVDAAASDISRSRAVGCVEGVRCEFPSAHRAPASAAPPRATGLRALVAKFDALQHTAHAARGLVSRGHKEHAVVLDEGVGLDLTGAHLSACGGYGVRVCPAPPGFRAPITLRLAAVKGCARGAVAFEALPGGGDAVGPGRVQPPTQAALLQPGGVARNNAGGDWLRNAPP